MNLDLAYTLCALYSAGFEPTSYVKNVNTKIDRQNLSSWSRKIGATVVMVHIGASDYAARFFIHADCGPGPSSSICATASGKFFHLTTYANLLKQIDLEELYRCSNDIAAACEQVGDDTLFKKAFQSTFDYAIKMAIAHNQRIS